jgi:hypothetical protein
MAPPPNKKRRTLAAVKAPLTGPPIKAGFKSSTRPLTPTAQAAAEKNKRRQDSQQVALPFDSTEKYKVGLKILLDESIYDNPNEVSYDVLCANFYFHFNLSLSYLFTLSHRYQNVQRVTTLNMK